MIIEIQINDMGNVSNAGERLYYTESACIIQYGYVKIAGNPTPLMKQKYYTK